MVVRLSLELEEVNEIVDLIDDHIHNVGTAVCLEQWYPILAKLGPKGAESVENWQAFEKRVAEGHDN
jgi:hypothetical protein